MAAVVIKAVNVCLRLTQNVVTYEQNDEKRSCILKLCKLLIWRSLLNLFLWFYCNKLLQNSYTILHFTK